MTKIMDHIRHLAVTIGPRGSATAAERRARDYVAQEMKALGLEVTLQEFPSITTFSWPYLILYLLPTLAFALSFESPVAGAVLAVLGSGAFYLELNFREVLEPLLPKGTGYNALGRLRGSNPHKKVVISAHHDSSKAALNFKPSLVGGFRTSFLLMALSLFLVPFLLVAYAFTGLEAIRWAAVPFLLYLLGTAASMVHREVWNRYTHGANDNASGVGTMLELAARASGEPLENLDLWFLSTGCEEAGTFGIRAFLRAHGRELRDACFINLDNVGAGTVHYMAGEGMLPTYSADPELLELFAAACRQRPELNVKRGLYTLMPTDATRCLAYGYRAISLLAVDDRGLLPNWHWITDTYDRVEEETVSTCAEIVWTVLKLMDAEQGTSREQTDVARS